MSKLKAFLIASDKKGYGEDEIVRHPKTGELATALFDCINNEWQAMQLVVCDVHNMHPLSHLDGKPNLFGNISFPYLYVKEEDVCYKMVASHPTIPNTAPLSEEFIREYVRLQGGCSIEYETHCIYGDNCPSMGAYDKQHLCDVRNNTDPSGNPILRIVPRTIVIDEETGENVLKGANVWSDADMEAAHYAGQVYGREYWESKDAASNWLTEYKNSNK
jgi:hypothetical protein